MERDGDLPLFKENECAVCPTCGAKTVRYKHVFNEALAVGLCRLYLAREPINLKDLGLTRNEWDNFQKLRYWDLVRKHVDSKGKRKGGFWEITEEGKRFLCGGSIYSHVWTYRGERVEYDGELIRVGGYLPKDYKQRVEYAEGAVAGE